MVECVKVTIGFRGKNMVLCTSTAFNLSSVDSTMGICHSFLGRHIHYRFRPWKMAWLYEQANNVRLVFLFLYNRKNCLLRWNLKKCVKDNGLLDTRHAYWVNDLVILWFLSNLVRVYKGRASTGSWVPLWGIPLENQRVGRPSACKVPRGRPQAPGPVGNRKIEKESLHRLHNHMYNEGIFK